MADDNSLQKKFIDSSTVSGILIAFSLVITAIFIGGNPQGFVDWRSILIVVFGTFAVTAACFSFSEVLSAISAIVHTIFYRSEDVKKAAIAAVQISDIARKKGFIGLDKNSHLTSHNPFFKNGVEMVVDQINAEEIGRVLDNEADSLAYRHAKSIGVLRKAAEVSPAMGLIGTLIGPVQMLGILRIRLLSALPWPLPCLLHFMVPLCLICFSHRLPQSLKEIQETSCWLQKFIRKL